MKHWVLNIVPALNIREPGIEYAFAFTYYQDLLGGFLPNRVVFLATAFSYMFSVSHT